ncbi:MAG TPA: NDP-sugar synthase [Solirubrobacteraceae bacterium]|nr:NDP-sugar synthase [Solirubrobacteraceae bacterium]
MQALILAGGEGTRLRPLTSTIPKPVVPLAGRPFITHMIDWLRAHGVDDVILACGFMAGAVRQVLGDGARSGVRLRYVEEPEPLGTGGALKYAQDLLDERFLMLNGDCLTDVDLTAQLAQHERTGALLTLGLIAVEDPSAYGLVRCDGDGRVTQFLEKPSAAEIDSNLVSLGAYVVQREVLDEMPPAGSRVSIERDVFPRLIGRGLYGWRASGYWLDIGTPERYLQATYDLLEGAVGTRMGRAGHGETGRSGHGQTGRTGHGEAGRGEIGRAVGTQTGRPVHGPALIGARCQIDPSATVGALTVLGDGVTVAAEAHIEGSVVLDGAVVGEGARISGSIVGPRARIGARCRIEGGVVVGEGVRLGAGNVLAGGSRLSPGASVPDAGVAP